MATMQSLAQLADLRPTTPVRHHHGGYTAEEKQSILENLDIEVADKKRRFDDYLERMLKTFLLRQESEVTKMNKSLRTMTMRDFGTKYNGDFTYAMQEMAREELQKGGYIELDASAKKRKRQEFAHEDLEHGRPSKSPRKMPSPTKKPVPMISRTPGRLPASKSARSPRGMLRTHTAPTNPFIANKPINSTSTPLAPSASQPLPQSRAAPALSTFNPQLPPTPVYPRRLRPAESLLSINGSPLANPYDDATEGLSDTSLDALPPTTLHQRLHGHGGRGERGASIMVRRESLTKSAASSAAPTALLSVPTKYGDVIEFDPLNTSPDELDALEGISDSAKKKAKEDMVKLVQQTLSKWTL